ncbi:MAG: helicase-related protein, partial [Alkalibacterium sp.]
GRSGIIYFSSKKKADDIAGRIREMTHLKAESYHSDVDPIDKKKIQAQFLKNELDIICATSAFGMGIDKPDIRYVIHYHLPANPEMYLQEIGRASRDKTGGIALLLYEQGDEYLQSRLQEESLPEASELRYAYKHPKALEALKDDNKARLAKYFIEQKIDLNEALIRIEARNEYKKKQLKIMVRYAETTGCKRELLLNYFNEELKVRPEECCSSCTSHLPLPYIRESALNVKEREQAWEVILNKLFNFQEQTKN